MDDLFEKDKNSQGEEEKPVVIKNEDGSFIINGKHYKDVDAVLESKVHADKHIDTVLSEKRQLEARMKESNSPDDEIKSLSAKIDALLQSKKRDSFFEDDEESDQVSDKNKTQTQNVDLDAIRGLINEAVKPLNDHITQIQQQTLRERFEGPLKAKYGEDKVREAVGKFQSETGLDADTIKTMISSNPEKVAELVVKVAGEPKQPRTKEVATDVTTENLSQQRTSLQDTSGSDFQSIVTKLRQVAKSGGQWTPQDQEAMNAAYDKERRRS